MTDTNSPEFQAGLAAYNKQFNSDRAARIFGDDALIAFVEAYEAAKPSGVQDISRAPRDGAKILGFDKAVGWHVTQWKNGDWFSEAYPQRGWWPQPTHFLPLPKPPTKGEA